MIKEKTLRSYTCCVYTNHIRQRKYISGMAGQFPRKFKEFACEDCITFASFAWTLLTKKVDWDNQAEERFNVNPLLSTFVAIAIERPMGRRIFSTDLRSSAVTTAIDGPTELIPTNSSFASRSMLM
jgi:hypothetical protein